MKAAEKNDIQKPEGAGKWNANTNQLCTDRSNQRDAFDFREVEDDPLRADEWEWAESKLHQAQSHKGGATNKKGQKRKKLLSDCGLNFKITEAVTMSMLADIDKLDLPRPELFDFHGVQMIHYFTDNWEAVQNFQARPDDILIATYPKAGTTWVSCILDLLYFGQTSPERQTSIPIYERVPFLEMFIPPIISGVDQAEKLLTTPRLFKTHFPVQFVSKSFWEQNCRIIYVARNPKDNMVSYFHFDCMNCVEPDPGDWNTFFQRFMEGKMAFGSWYDHVSGWWKKRETYSNLHYMFFEDLVEDTGREIDKLCSFLGLSPSAEVKKQITGEVQFDNMKKNSMANYSTIPVMNFKISPFMRKGKVGDWKKHLTVAQNEEFDKDFRKKMKEPTLQFRTEI